MLAIPADSITLFASDPNFCVIILLTQYSNVLRIQKDPFSDDVVIQLWSALMTTGSRE